MIAQRSIIEYPASSIGVSMVKDREALIGALKFPDDKSKIARLPFDLKMEWYAYQFQKDPQAATILLSSDEFERFWKWNVLMPTKFKRLYYRLKNLEVFKRYKHITEMKKKGPSRI